MPFREISSSEKGLVGVGVDITELCNRKCPTCFAHHSPQSMGFGTFRRIVDEAKRLGFTEFYVLGGEPLFHPQVIDFLRYAQGKFNLVILVTNMDRLSDRALCKAVFDTGVVIAGQRHTLESDDAARKLEYLLAGGDHLATSHQAWRNVEEIFPPERVCVQCCITKPVVESGSIYEVFKWARTKGYEPVMEFTKEGDGFFRGCSLDVSSAEMLEVLESFRAIDQYVFGLEGAQLLAPQAYGKTCHMLENSIHFLVDGSAVPCVGHHDVPYGNISTDPLDRILDHPLRQAMKNPHDWIFGYCRDECPDFDACTGGCRGSAFDMSGCPRASFYYCPHIPKERLSLADMIPPTCQGCPLETHSACKPKR